jgi:hypothetical protein
MAALSRKSLGLFYRALRTAWHWALRLWAGRSARRERRRRQPVDLLALARRVHELERQLGRARVHHASRQLSRQQLEQLYQHTVTEVQALLGALDLAGDALGPGWAVERLRGVTRRWQDRSAGTVAGGALHPHDVSELQAQLLEITTALTVCGRVNGHDTRR